MKQLARIRDTVYPPKPLPFFRECARGLIMDPQGRIGMIHIQGTDEFGIRDHLESCGGGIEPKETAEQTLIREAREELGVDCFQLRPIGWTLEELNLLQRRTRSFFFAARCGEVRSLRRLSPWETKMMSEPVWLSVRELLIQLQPRNARGVAVLLARRDRLALQEALRRGLFEKRIIV